MNEPNWLHEYAGLPLEEWPEDLKTRVEENPQWREIVRHQADTARTLSLKQYEHPDPAMEGRVRHRVGVQLRNGAVGNRAMGPRPLVFIDNLPDWARMAAAVVVMLGLSVMTHREMLRDGDRAAADTPFPEQEALESFQIPEETASAPVSAPNWDVPAGEWPRSETVRPPDFLLNDRDPFITTVRFPERVESSRYVFSLPAGVTNGMENGFPPLSAAETNRVDAASTLPVRLPLDP